MHIAQQLLLMSGVHCVNSKEQSITKNMFYTRVYYNLIVISGLGVRWSM